MVYSKCKIEGVILVLEMSVEYFVVLFLIPPIENFLSSVTAVLLLTSFNCLIYIAIQIFCTVHSVLCHFHELEVSVNLVKIPGHLGIIGNDIADSKAKETAYMLLSGNISVPQNITFSNACKISANIAVSLLQRKWNESNTGRYTYELIPNVEVKILFPAKRDIGISYSRMLLHDTMLKDDSYRTGTSFSPICDCGSGERETSELTFSSTM